MRKRTSGCRGLEMAPTSQRAWRWLITSRVPRWWIKPVYRAATRLLANKKNAAARCHTFKLATDFPVGEAALKVTRGNTKTFEVKTRTYHRRSYRTAAPGRWTWTLYEEANWNKGFNRVSLTAVKTVMVLVHAFYLRWFRCFTCTSRASRQPPPEEFYTFWSQGHTREEREGDEGRWQQRNPGWSTSATDESRRNPPHRRRCWTSGSWTEPRSTEKDETVNFTNSSIVWKSCGSNVLPFHRTYSRSRLKSPKPWIWNGKGKMMTQLKHEHKTVTLGFEV